MKPANDDGTRPALRAVNIEELSFRVGISEDQVRRIAISNEEEIAGRILQAAEDAVRDLAYCEGILDLSEPEPLTEVLRTASGFAPDNRFAPLEIYDDRPPAQIYLVDLDK